MKKVLSFLLSAILLVSLCAPALAESKFDFSYVKEHSDAYDISVDSDQDCAFIATILSVSNRSFTHDLESPVRYSSFETDILVNDYYGKTPYGILRTWIIYSADEDLGITSVSFFLNDKEYIFSGIGNQNWHYTYDDGIVEKVLIVYGNSSDYEDFFTDFLSVAASAVSDDTVNVKIVLHGVQDVSATIDQGVLSDWLAMVIAFSESNGKLSDAVGSTLKVVDVK